MTAFAPSAIRASEFARCPRMAALRGRGAEQHEYDEQTKRFFARGHLYTTYVVEQLRQKHGEENVESEVAIEWPLGVGHADAYIRPSKLLVEIKSTVTPTTTSPMFEMAVRQLQVYLRFHPEAEAGALYLVNPSDLRGEDVFRVVLSEEDRQEIDLSVAQAAEALEEGGRLPTRICLKPSQGRGRLCPFITPCFEGWQEPEPTELSDPAVLDVVQRMFALKAQKRPHADAIKTLEETEKAVKAEAAEVLPEGESLVGPFKVVRTHVRRAPKFSEKVAKAAGFPVEALHEFMLPGAQYDTFRVTRAEEAGAIDYGDDPPF